MVSINKFILAENQDIKKKNKKVSQFKTWQLSRFFYLVKNQFLWLDLFQLNHPFMFKKIKLFIFLSIITCSASIGQIDGITQNRDFRQGFSIYFIAPAFVSGNESNLNPILRENGYPALPQGSLNWGIGFNYRYNRWLASLDGLVANQTRSNPISNSRLARTAFTGNLTLAHYIVQRKFGASSYTLLQEFQPLKQI